MQKGGSVSYKNELGKLIQSLEIYLQAMKDIDQSIAQLFPNAGDNPRPGIRREGLRFVRSIICTLSITRRSKSRLDMTLTPIGPTLARNPAWAMNPAISGVVSSRGRTKAIALRLPR